MCMFQDDDELDPEDVVIDERTETGSKSKIKPF